MRILHALLETLSFPYRNLPLLEYAFKETNIGELIQRAESQKDRLGAARGGTLVRAAFSSDESRYGEVVARKMDLLDSSNLYWRLFQKYEIPQLMQVRSWVIELVRHLFAMRVVAGLKYPVFEDVDEIIGAVQKTGVLRADEVEKVTAFYVGRLRDGGGKAGV